MTSKQGGQDWSANNHPHVVITRSSSSVWRKPCSQPTSRGSKKSKNEPPSTGAVEVVGFAAQFAALCQERGLLYVPDVVLLRHPSFSMQMSTSIDYRGKELETFRGDCFSGDVRVSMAVEHSSSRVRLTRTPKLGSISPSLNPKGPRISPPPSPRAVVRASVAGSPRTVAGSGGGLMGRRTSTFEGAGQGSALLDESTRKGLNYFRPQIQVEQDDPEDPVSVTAIHIRGWKVDTPTTEILTQCWRYLPCLRSLRLTNCSLHGQPLGLLASALSLLPALHSVSLDNNPLQSSIPPVSVLLGRSSRPWHLSLRFCRLGDDQVEDLAQKLGVSTASITPHPSIQHADEGLVTLNLSNNDISDVGAGHLADALRSNRSLAVLNLAGNKVGDAGVCALAQAVSWFPLSPHQESVRRALIHAELETDPDNMSSPIEVRAAPSIKASGLRTPSRQSFSKECGLNARSHPHTNALSRTPADSDSSSTFMNGGHFLCHGVGGKGGGGGGANDTASAKSKKKVRRTHGSFARKMSRRLDIVLKVRSSATTKTDKEGQEKKDEVKRMSSKIKADKEEEKKGVVETKKNMPGTKARKEKEKNNGKRTSISQRSQERYRPRYKPSWVTDPCVVGVPSYGEHPHPFLGAAVVLQGKIWLPGNRSLMSLNLSRNQVGPRGVQALLRALGEQRLPSQDLGPGLRRLELHRNPVMADQGCGPLLQELVAKLRLKDLRCATVHLGRSWVTPCALPVATLG